MSINKNTMEVTRKIGPGVYYWSADADEVEYELIDKRKNLMRTLKIQGTETLNEGLKWMNLHQSIEGMTLGWEFDSDLRKDDLLTWAWLPNGVVEVTFHNLKDISNLYKTEEELA